MKTLGLIGGTSWISTADYYRIINQRVNEQLGALNSAKLFLYSLNYEESRPSPDPAEQLRIAHLLTDIAERLQNAGAECIIICANTMHMAADIIQKKINIPLIHIAEVTAKEIVKQKINKVALLGTKFTMEWNFFTEKLSAAGITTLIPGDADRDFIHATVFNELGKGIFTSATKEKYLNIIDLLVQQGAEGIIFGCTEIPMLIKEEECSVPVFDTMLIHAKAAVEFALK